MILVILVAAAGPLWIRIYLLTSSRATIASESGVVCVAVRISRISGSTAAVAGLSEVLSRPADRMEVLLQLLPPVAVIRDNQAT